MSHELQALRTCVTHLLPPTRSVRLTEMTIEPAYVLLQLTTTAAAARCPQCTVLSSSVHSRYQRHLTDLPWGARAVRLQLTVRKFVCRNPSCRRRIFTERLPRARRRLCPEDPAVGRRAASDRHGPRWSGRGTAHAALGLGHQSRYPVAAGTPSAPADYPSVACHWG
jgi:hypothetical protein